MTHLDASTVVEAGCLVPMRRVVGVAGTEFERGLSIVAGEGFRAYEVSALQTVVDQSVLPWNNAEGLRGRIQHALVLSGEYLVHRDGRTLTLRAGDVLCEQMVSARERWEGGAFRLLVLEWEQPEPFERSVHRLGSRDLAALDALARELAAPGSEPLAQAQQIAERLAPEGADALREALARAAQSPAGRSMHETAAVLGTMTSNLSCSPMWVDFSERLGFSERHGRRRLAPLLALLGAAPQCQGLREYLRRTRISHAAGFLASPGVTVEQVARSLGYGSARALGTALRQAGLPSPTELARRTRLGTF